MEISYWKLLHRVSQKCSMCKKITSEMSIPVEKIRYFWKPETSPNFLDLLGVR